MATTREAMRERLRETLGAVAKKHFPANDALDRQLDAALRALGRYRPRLREGSVTLEAGQATYALPAELVRIVRPLWGRTERAHRKPWSPVYPHGLPWPEVLDGDDGPLLLLDPAPSAGQIGDLGAEYTFTYTAHPTLGATAEATTLPAADEDLLLQRSLAEAMRDLSVLGVVEPIQFHRGVGSVPANATPSAVREALLRTWYEEVRR